MGFHQCTDWRRGWLESKRTDQRVEIIHNTNNTSHGHSQDAQIDHGNNLLLTGSGSDVAADLGRSFQSSWSYKRNRGSVLPPKGFIIHKGLPLPPKSTQLLQDSKACLRFSLAYWKTFCWRDSQVSSACARLSWKETH